MKLPAARNENIVVQNLKDEVLIYDLITNKAFCLNTTSTIVFNACHNKLSFDELKAKYQLTDDLIFYALDGLKKENLIESETTTHFVGLSRREVIRRVGLGSFIALPVISSVIAPTAAYAQSTVICTNPAGIPIGQPVSGTGVGVGPCYLNLGSQCCILGADNLTNAPAPGGGVTCSGTCSSTPFTF